jgi:hypothetical protein
MLRDIHDAATFHVHFIRHMRETKMRPQRPICASSKQMQRVMRGRAAALLRCARRASQRRNYLTDARAAERRERAMHRRVMRAVTRMPRCRDHLMRAAMPFDEPR